MRARLNLQFAQSERLALSILADNWLRVASHDKISVQEEKWENHFYFICHQTKDATAAAAAAGGETMTGATDGHQRFNSLCYSQRRAAMEKPFSSHHRTKSSSERDDGDEEKRGASMRRSQMTVLSGNETSFGMIFSHFPPIICTSYLVHQIDLI